MNSLLLSVFLAIAAVYVGLVWFAWTTKRKVERLVPPHGTFVTVQGVPVHYVSRGDGPITVLCIHGLAGNARHFTAHVLEALSQQYRVIVVDRPGAGYSGALSVTPTPQAQAAFLAAVIEALGLERPLVVGHSLGGAVALALATEHPERVAALALVAPLTQAPSTVPAVFAGLVLPSALMRQVVGWTLAIPLSIARRDQVLTAVFSPERVPADFPLRGGGLLGMRPSAFASSSTDLMAVTPPEVMAALTSRYAGITVPVGVLYGTHDRILEPRLQGERLMQQIPHATLEWVEMGGHMLPLTVPDRVVSFVQEVAARVAPAAATAG
ncbi:MAG: alpha/beta hydrolase [Gemmatimonadaceae bacterium]|nr:alpha/beta hydrolase [Gemmatimonadaceae bacterium]